MTQAATATQYQLLPDLTSEEFEVLKADIAARGVQVPVELDEQGNVLDGHHRIRACRELGLTEWPSIIRTGMSEDEKREHVLALNLDRRHLSQAQRRDLIAKLLVAKPEASNREVAEQAKTSDHTVASVRGELESGAQIAHLDRTVGQDGKSYPSHRPAVFAPTPKAAERAQRVLDTHIPTSTTGAVLTVPELQQEARDHKRQEKREAAEEIATTVPVSDRLTLLEGDFNERMAELADASVDLIFTDPPYADDFTPNYEVLAAHASRVLKPAGSLITYVGQNSLRDVLNLMDGYLRYWWILCARHKGGAARLAGKHVIVEWKPLLWYVRDCRRPDAEYLVDFVEFGRETEKELHDWQQQEAPAHWAIEKLTQPGDVVLDPFLGSGTTLAAALRLGRYGIGIELDPETMARARARLAEVTP